jgi:hypothetical protein
VRQLRRQSRTEEVPMFTIEEQGNSNLSETGNKVVTEKESTQAEVLVERDQSVTECVTKSVTRPS